MNARNQIISKKTGWDSFPVKALILYGLNYWLSLGLSLKGHVWNMLEIYNPKKNIMNFMNTLIS